MTRSHRYHQSLASGPSPQPPETPAEPEDITALLREAIHENNDVFDGLRLYVTMNSAFAKDEIATMYLCQWLGNITPEELELRLPCVAYHKAIEKGNACPIPMNARRHLPLEILEIWLADLELRAVLLQLTSWETPGMTREDRDRLGWAPGSINHYCRSRNIIVYDPEPLTRNLKEDRFDIRVRSVRGICEIGNRWGRVWFNSSHQGPFMAYMKQHILHLTRLYAIQGHILEVDAMPEDSEHWRPPGAENDIDPTPANVQVRTIS